MRFDQRPEILKHFNLLQNLGIFGQMEDLYYKIDSLEELLFDASSIFSQKEMNSLIENIVHCLGAKFVPTNLTFLIQDRQEGIQVISYRDLRPAPNSISIASLTSLEQFFLQFPNTIHFELFEYQFPDTQISNELKKANPQIIVPVMGIAGLYGLILIGPKLMDSQYTDVEIGFIDRLMKFTAISIQNVINYTNAVTDIKTGLYNHSFFMKRLAEEWSSAHRYHDDLGLLVIDIDHFKQFNDTYGHLAGDVVIDTIGNVIRTSVREGDIVARFGGEEFTVLFKHSDRLRTWNSAERIRKKVEGTRVSYKDNSLSVTVSIGATTCRYNPNEVLDDFIINADEALYQAKALGRNRTAMYGESLLFSALHRSTFPIQKKIENSTIPTLQPQ